MLGDVVRVWRVGNQQIPVGNGRPHHKGVRLRRLVRGKARHEAAAQLQHWRSVVPRGRFNVGQREPNPLDDLEGVGSSARRETLFVRNVRLNVQAKR